MSGSTAKPRSDGRLRELAEITLAGGIQPPSARTTPGAGALATLYRMATDPATAGHALKLLHELQVHQVELDLQHEDMDRARAELTASLDRYRDLFDVAPGAYFVIALDGTILEANRAGSDLLGIAQQDLCGRLFLGFVAPGGGVAVSDLMARVRSNGINGACIAGVNTASGGARIFQITACPSQRGDAIFVTLSDQSTHDL